ncbi:probable U3 small nucleolar RNA-associated protein 16 isoform X2 [Portunus trituberculatus]|uniref:probable U3 small nucleolar RNA-associated protein 16 isoform X2 n=1 Tax=Portunus trituberculatus TaxID=210409 RepID=UPI001E1D11D9|nr:probable U3 small nucleolar RNA-associated protein 16 isoform X2 [Portunus trituberculatus]
MALKKGNRHITFDDDENFEDPPALDPVGRDSDEAALEEDAEDSDSDSDAAPEEATISAGKEDAQLREDLVKSAVSKRRQEIREKRKEQHEKNKLQQEEKRSVWKSDAFHKAFWRQPPLSRR